MGLSFEEALAVMKNGGIVRRPNYGRVAILIRKEDGRNRICQIGLSNIERYRADNNIPLQKYRFRNTDIFANDFEVL